MLSETHPRTNWILSNVFTPSSLLLLTLDPAGRSVAGVLAAPLSAPPYPSEHLSIPLSWYARCSIPFIFLLKFSQLSPFESASHAALSRASRLFTMPHSLLQSLLAHCLHRPLMRRSRLYELMLAGLLRCSPLYFLFLASPMPLTRYACRFTQRPRRISPALSPRHPGAFAAPPRHSIRPTPALAAPRERGAPPPRDRIGAPLRETG